MLRALVFDLDDTLYNERDFVMSGYRAVAGHLHESGLCSFESAFALMEKTFDEKGREAVFSALVEMLPAGSAMISELIEVYRQHKPAIQLCPGYMSLLRKMSRRYRLGVITDGMPAVQQRKVQALGLKGLMDEIVYTWAYGADKQKPHPHSFSLMLKSLRTDPRSTLYIGDNPEKDCKGAHSVGIPFVQVRHAECGRDTPGSTVAEHPEYVIETLFQLPEILQYIN